MNIRPNPGTQAAAAEYRQCFKCNFEGPVPHEICQSCGSRLYTARSIRTRGIVVLLCGVFISGLMIAIAVFVGLLLAGSMKDPSSARRINEEFATLALIYGLFLLLIGLGIQFAVTGAWMVIAGRRNRYLVWIMWAGIILVFGFGFFIRLLL